MCSCVNEAFLLLSYCDTIVTWNGLLPKNEMSFLILYYSKEMYCLLALLARRMVVFKLVEPMPAARKVIQLNHVDGAELLCDPNDNPRNEHDYYCTRKKVACISYRHNGKMFICFQQSLAWMVKRKRNGNLKQESSRIKSKMSLSKN